MKLLFPEKLILDDFDALRDKVKAYVRKSLNKQHTQTVSSLEAYQIYKPGVQSLNDVPYYKLDSSEYKYFHCLSVAQNCIKLCRLEGRVNCELLELAGLMHDIGHFKGDYRKHGIVSANMAAEFLSSESSLDDEQINGIAKVIRAHYPEKLDKRYYYSDDISLEEILLLEADFLDKLNPRRGIINFLEFGSNRKSIENSIDQYEIKIINKAYDILTMPVEKESVTILPPFCSFLKNN
jgi:putative nucleotidyltransferase with HDIG domain